MLKPLISKEVITLDLLEEKKELIKLITELTHERQIITHLYESIENRLNRIKEIEKEIYEGKALKETSLIPKSEIDRTRFYDQKIKTASIPYDIISKDICYVLKNSSKPMNGSQIHSTLTATLHFNLDYKNLVNNILPKIVKDKNLPIEKISRGFWQYRRV